MVGGRNVPIGAAQQVRPRAVHREVGRRVIVAGGVLVLPLVAYYGAPVILDVPGVGFVDVPEDEYAGLYDKLSSSDPEQVQEAMASLQKIKAAEEAQVEAAQRGADNVMPADGDAPAVPERDLSEPVSFGTPSMSRAWRGADAPRRLY
jgi:hypothetical protein